MQRKQAFHSVSIFYELKNRDLDKVVELNNKNQDNSMKKLSYFHESHVH